MPKSVEFFFDYTSPYSYLASTQIEALAQRAGAALHWRPFFLGGVFQATGNMSPAANPYKGLYLLKDLNDWIAHYRLPPLTFPNPFPLHSLLADRVGLAVGQVGRLPEYSHAMFRRIFAEGQDASDPQVIEGTLTELGLPAADLLAQAQSQPVKDELRRNTDEAVRRGAFGAPTFFVGDLMFVGNDRLHFVEAALKS